VAYFLTFILGEGRKKPNMYMVMPYMEHDLSGLLENPDVHFTEPQIKCYLMQLLEGLRYLHAVRTLQYFVKKTLSDLHHRTAFCIVT
jgi:serine/threonine-protein kinase BUR1